MNLKIVKQIISVVIFSAIPAFLSYLANSSLIFNKLIEYGVLGKNVNVELIQDYCLWIGIILSAIVLSTNLLVTKIKYENILEQRNLLIKMNKNILSTSLGKRFLSNTSSFDIRIFIPKHSLLYKLADKLHFASLSRKFIIKNIDLIAEQGITKDLQFEVFPNPQGLVGMCYDTKLVVFDDDLEHTNSNSYNLKTNQIDRTSNLKWSICCPICDNNDTVVAIMALDGKAPIKISKEKETALNKEIVAFSRMLYDSVPQLFKR